MEHKYNKINDKVEYQDNEIQAQACSDDCTSYTNSSWVDLTGHPTTVGGSAIIVVCSKYDCKETSYPSSETWPLW